MHEDIDLSSPQDEEPDSDKEPFWDFDLVSEFSHYDGSMDVDPVHHIDYIREGPDADLAVKGKTGNVPYANLVTPETLPEGRILSTAVASRLTQIEEARYFRATGFNYCKSLDNSSFDSLTYFHPWQSTIAKKNPSVDEFIFTIDEEAKRLSLWLMEKQWGILRKADVERFTCMAVADGSNTYANLTDTRMLHQIDRNHFLGPIIPSITPADSLIPGPRRKYKLAYLLMVHGKAAVLENIRYLLDVLDDGTAIILIHVDLSSASDELYGLVSEYVTSREAAMNEKLRPGEPPEPGNVFMAKNRFEGMWGHSSLVFMQLSGFWELLDLADWDNVINLSANDFPLRASADISRLLSSPKYRNRDFVEWTPVSIYMLPYTAESATRITRPHLPKNAASKEGIQLYHPKEVGVKFPPYPRWKICKHHQWMILTPEFVNYLRSSDEALLILAFLEHTWIPDETYFCYVLINSPHFHTRSINGNKRFLRFAPGSMHPSTLDIKKTEMIGVDANGTEPQNLVIRKVEPRTAEGRALLAWIYREHIDKHRGALKMADEEPAEGEQWVDLEASRQNIAAMMRLADAEYVVKPEEGGIPPLPPPGMKDGAGDDEDDEEAQLMNSNQQEKQRDHEKQMEAHWEEHN
ncbi:hypothetical protein HK101_006319 [Irineochytrium annulatum]|nr:hypothetical protein HK101_006319 [Irineochytrium annulatum]